MPSLPYRSGAGASTPGTTLSMLQDLSPPSPSCQVLVSHTKPSHQRTLSEPQNKPCPCAHGPQAPLTDSAFYSARHNPSEALEPQGVEPRPHDPQIPNLTEGQSTDLIGDTKSPHRYPMSRRNLMCPFTFSLWV